MQDDHDDNFSQPLFNALPSAVVALALALLVVELFLWAADSGYLGGDTGIGWRNEAITQIGFFPQVFAPGNWEAKYLTRFVSFPFVHFGTSHAIFAIVLLLALGKIVGEVFGNVAVLVLFFGCAIVGSFVYGGLTWEARPLVGAYPSVYGFIGAYTLILWINYGQMGENQYQAFTLIAFLIGINLLFDLIFGLSPELLAKITGFGFGFLIAPFLAKGAFRQLLARIRQR